MVGTAGSWFLMSKVGRRTIHFSGLCCQFLLLIIVGSLSFAGGDGHLWAIGALLVLFTFVCKFHLSSLSVWDH